MKKIPDYFNGEFKLFSSCYNKPQLISSELPQILLLGKSNVGKSSLINLLCNQKRLAKTSKTPGRTISINFFINQKHQNFLLVDFPGYGFAKVSDKQRKIWDELISTYLKDPKAPKETFLLHDCRRDISDLDLGMISLLEKHKLRFHLILTKCDKLSKLEVAAKKESLASELKASNFFGNEIFITSSSKRTGLNELKKYFNEIIYNGYN